MDELEALAVPDGNPSPAFRTRALSGGVVACGGDALCTADRNLAVVANEHGSTGSYLMLDPQLSPSQYLRGSHHSSSSLTYQRPGCS